jgi:hypothetical protein
VCLPSRRAGGSEDSLNHFPESKQIGYAGAGRLGHVAMCSRALPLEIIAPHPQPQGMDGPGGLPRFALNSGSIPAWQGHKQSAPQTLQDFRQSSCFSCWQ